MYLKVMTTSYKGYKYILCVIDKVTNNFLTAPIHQAKSEEIGHALIENVLTKYCIPEHIMMDQYNTFIFSHEFFIQKVGY